MSGFTKAAMPSTQVTEPRVAPTVLSSDERQALAARREAWSPRHGSRRPRTRVPGHSGQGSASAREQIASMRYIGPIPG